MRLLVAVVAFEHSIRDTLSFLNRLMFVNVSWEIILAPRQQAVSVIAFDAARFFTSTISYATLTNSPHSLLPPPPSPHALAQR